MAAKKGAIERTLRKAQSVLASYIKPGRSAEKSIDELLRVLHDTRVTLMRSVKQATGTRSRRTSRASTAKRRPAAAAARKRAAVKSKAKTRSKRTRR